jgi:hypothetical protein
MQSYINVLAQNEAAEEDPYRIPGDSVALCVQQQGCRSTLRRILGSAMVVACVLALLEAGAVQSQWQAASLMDRMSRHDQQLTLGLQAVTPMVTLPPPAPGLHISGVWIDITDQDGVTVNIDPEIDVKNDMNDTFIGNNQAISKEGNVQRMNGAFANNDLLGSDNLRLNGMVREGESGGQDETNQAKTQEVDATKVAGKADASIGATYSGMKGAVDKVSKNEINAVKSSQEDSSQKTFGFLEQSQKSAQAAQSGMVASIMTGLSPLLKSLNITGSVNISNATSTGNAVTVNVGNGSKHSMDKASIGIAQYDKLLEALVNGNAGKAGPVVIDNVHIKIKKQRGVQANFNTGIVVTNNMAGSFHDNNKAMSEEGSVLRVNGVMNRNVIHHPLSKNESD